MVDQLSFSVSRTANNFHFAPFVLGRLNRHLLETEAISSRLYNTRLTGVFMNPSDTWCDENISFQFSSRKSTLKRKFVLNTSKKSIVVRGTQLNSCFICNVTIFKVVHAVQQFWEVARHVCLLFDTIWFTVKVSGWTQSSWHFLSLGWCDEAFTVTFKEHKYYWLKLNV